MRKLFALFFLISQFSYGQQLKADKDSVLIGEQIKLYIESPFQN